jgi:hypothetical protein
VELAAADQLQLAWLAQREAQAARKGGTHSPVEGVRVGKVRHSGGLAPVAQLSPIAPAPIVRPDRAATGVATRALLEAVPAINARLPFEHNHLHTDVQPAGGAAQTLLVALDTERPRSASTTRLQPFNRGMRSAKCGVERGRDGGKAARSAARQATATQVAPLAPGGYGCGYRFSYAYHRWRFNCFMSVTRDVRRAAA